MKVVVFDSVFCCLIRHYSSSYFYLSPTENNPKSIHVTSETVPDSTQDDLTQSFVRSNVDCVPETDTPDHINFEDLIEIVEVNGMTFAIF